MHDNALDWAGALHRAEQQETRKNLVLHIGYGKTGTSAIQNALAYNEPALSKRGFYYPTCARGGTTAHHQLAAAARPIRDTGYESKRSTLQWIGHLAHEIESRPEQTVILSSEIFSGKLIFKEIDPLFRVFGNVTVAVYLRRQDDLIMSSYQQWVKHGTKTVDLPCVESLPYHFDRGLKEWVKFLGNRGCVLVRPYERVQLHKGDVVADFLFHVLGIANQDDFSKPLGGRANDRMGRRCFLFKNIANALLSEQPAAQLATRLLTECAQLDQDDPWDGSIAAPAQRIQWMRAFEDGNRWIARTLMNRENGRLFTENIVEDGRAWTAPSLSTEEALEVASVLLDADIDDLRDLPNAEAVVRACVTRLFGKGLLQEKPNIQRQP